MISEWMELIFDLLKGRSLEKGRMKSLAATGMKLPNQNSTWCILCVLRVIKPERFITSFICCV